MTTTPPSSRRLIAVSTKMYFSASRTTSFITSILPYLASNPSIFDLVDIAILPDHVTLTSVISQLSSVPVLVGAQDAHSSDAGAFTGCVSPAVLAEVGCRLLEVGHAERRRLFGETDESVAGKVAAAVRNGMVPLVCVGEQTRPAEVGAGAAAAVEELRSQVESALAEVPEDEEVVFAYEPVWAIGAKEPASPEHVVEVVMGIKRLEAVRRRTGMTRVIYGGSAGPGLFDKFDGKVDGLFLGRFGHDPKRFLYTVGEVAFGVQKADEACKTM